MRRTALIAAGLLTLAAILALAPDFQDMLARNAMALQREAQDALGAVLRALRNGQPGAISGFLILCLAHGFLHALGPGHGKAGVAAA